MERSDRAIYSLTPADEEIVRVVQLTDTHLCRQRGGTLLSMDTDHSLQAVIAQVQRERPELDLVLATGDLADGGAREAYERLQEYLSALGRDHFWLPGNHDDLAAMEAIVNRPERLYWELRVGHWQILRLDTQIPGEVGGEIGPGELRALERSLEIAVDAGLHSLICMHHQPVPVGSEWIDEQMVADAGQFFEVLDRFNCVRGVLWGHVHQEIDRDHRGVRLMASPSTCVQFAPGSKDFRADDKPPGYRWLDLHKDGRIETGVSRVTDVAFTVDLESSGYL